MYIIQEYIYAHVASPKPEIDIQVFTVGIESPPNMFQLLLLP